MREGKKKKPPLTIRCPHAPSDLCGQCYAVEQIWKTYCGSMAPLFRPQRCGPWRLPQIGWNSGSVRRRRGLR